MNNTTSDQMELDRHTTPAVPRILPVLQSVRHRKISMTIVKTLKWLILGILLTGSVYGQSDIHDGIDKSVKSNRELLDLFDRDQADHSGVWGDIDWTRVRVRDSLRQARVLELLDSNKVVTSVDYYHAAMVFQHGRDTTAARLAHTLAQTSVRLDSMNASAKWLVAASWDRYQMRLGRPQWYGTQYLKNSDGLWQLYEIDTTAVTDEMRAQMGVSSLKELRARVEKRNQK